MGRPFEGVVTARQRAEAMGERRPHAEQAKKLEAQMGSPYLNPARASGFIPNFASMGSFPLVLTRGMGRQGLIPMAGKPPKHSA